MVVSPIPFTQPTFISFPSFSTCMEALHMATFIILLFQLLYFTIHTTNLIPVTTFPSSYLPYPSLNPLLSLNAHSYPFLSHLLPIIPTISPPSHPTFMLHQTHHHFHFYPLISIKPMPPRLHGHAWPHKPLQMSPPFLSILHVPLCPLPFLMCMKSQVHGHLHFFHLSYPSLHFDHHHSLSRNISRVSLSFTNHIPSMRFTH